MVNKTVYKEYMAGQDEQQILVSLSYGDCGYAAAKLKSARINREFFIKMLHAAMDSGIIPPVDFLLTAYHKIVNQAVIDDIVRYATLRRYWQYVPFFDSYIDRMNTLNAELSETKNKKSEYAAAEDKPEPRQGIIGTLKEIFKKHLK